MNIRSRLKAKMKRTEIEQLLPGIFQRTVRPGNPLAALLEVMEDFHQPSEEILNGLDASFDPRRTREDFLPFLARWLDLSGMLRGAGTSKGPSPSSEPISTGIGRLRELLASAAYLSQWTATRKGLERFLQVATGEDKFEILENQDRHGRRVPFHFTVVLPASMKLHFDLIKRIVEREKPAYVTCDIV
jgi:phage tail-like protein